MCSCSVHLVACSFAYLSQPPDVCSSAQSDPSLWQVALLKQHSGAINAVQYMSFGGLLATASSDTNVALWDLHPLKSG